MRRAAREYIPNIFAWTCLAGLAGAPACAGSASSHSASAAPAPTATVADVGPTDASVFPSPPADSPHDLDASTDGGPSPVERAVVAKLKTVHPTLLACHQVAKSFGGEFTLAMVIGAGGKVANIAVAKRSSTAPAVASCVLDRVKQLRFDVENVSIEIPFHFVHSAYDGPTLHYGSGPYDPGY